MVLCASLLPLWSAEAAAAAWAAAAALAAATAEAMAAAACGGNGGGVLLPREAAASARSRCSRSSANALSRGEMSIIGEVEAVLEAALKVSK